jgi:hypothetical protein
MSNSCALRLGRFTATVAILAWIVCVQPAPAQTLQWKAAPNGLIPMLGTESIAGPSGQPALNQRANPVRRAPLAYLIENPDQTDGAPPFALTDQTGTIQRYVEPVPGIDLAPFVDQVVVVRNDTGPTLLASQLELPRQPLYPLVGERGYSRPAGGPSFTPPRRSANSSGVEQAQYVDDDDASVQLLPDDVSLPGGTPMSAGNAVPLEMLGPGGEYPGYPNQMMLPEMGYPGYGPQFGDPMQCGPGAIQPYPGQMMGPGPQFGGYQNAYGSGQQAGCGPSGNAADSQRAHFSGDVEFMFLRPRINEEAVGKLSETYQFSPRFVLEARNGGNLDGRVRYWHYGRDTETLDGDEIRLEFDVLDIEAVHRLEGRRSQVALAAGIRLAHLQLTDDSDEKSGSDLIGLTMAADGLTQLACFSGGYCGWVYGGRFSILGGDWGGDDNSVFIDHQIRDDNVLVSELYAGMEVARRCRNVNVGGRVVFELQNWRSDALSDDAEIESIGFLGPALQIGAEF